MSELVKCPFCKKPLEIYLIAGFWFCEKCGVAVRAESDMPLRGEHIYDQEWVQVQERSKYILKRSHWLLRRIKELNGVKRVLDIGCGTGILVDILTKSGYKAKGIDSSPEAVRFAESHKQGEFELASTEFLQDEGGYDLIIAAQLIEHLRNPEHFLERVKGLLKSYGYLLVETPNLDSWNEKSLWRKTSNGIGGMHGADHRICYTVRGLVQLLQDNNFDIIEVCTRTYSPRIFSGLIQSLYFAFVEKGKKSLSDNAASAKVSLGLTKRILRKLYRLVMNSCVLDILLYIPNRISEINHRGQQLVIIARKRD